MRVQKYFDETVKRIPTREHYRLIWSRVSKHLVGHEICESHVLRPGIRPGGCALHCSIKCFHLRNALSPLGCCGSRSSTNSTFASRSSACNSLAKITWNNINANNNSTISGISNPTVRIRHSVIHGSNAYIGSQTNKYCPKSWKCVLHVTFITQTPGVAPMYQLGEDRRVVVDGLECVVDHTRRQLRLHRRPRLELSK